MKIPLSIAVLILLLPLPAGAVPAPTPVDDAELEGFAYLGAEIADAMLGLHIKKILLHEFGHPARDVVVRVERGTVTLSGSLTDRSTRELVPELVAAVDGVEELDDRLTLTEAARPAPPERAELELADALLETRVQALLLEEMGRHALDLEVEAASGVVSVTGEIDDWRRRDLALDAIRELDGVVEVVDQLTLEPAEP